MKKTLIIIGAVAGAACSRSAPAVQVTPPLVLPFSITSPVDSVRGTFIGVARQNGSWIDVTIDSAFVDLPAGAPERWRAMTLSAFIAAAYNHGDFKAPAEARRINVFRFLDFSKTANSAPRRVKIDAPLQFSVPVPAGALLASARMAIEMEWTFAYGGYGETDSRIAFSPSLGPPIR